MIIKKTLTVFLFMFVTLSFIPLAHSETIVFGPETYTCGTGKPQKVFKNFSVQYLNQEFTATVHQLLTFAVLI